METLHFQEKIKQTEPLEYRHFPEQNPAFTGKTPEGYLTGKEFVELCTNDIIQFCKEHDLL